MKKINLFIDKAKNYYLVNKEKVFCDECSNQLTNILFMITNWKQKNSNCIICCNECLIKVEKSGVIYEAKYGRITKYFEPDFTPVFIQPPTLLSSKSDVSVFEASFLDSEETNDQAWRSREYPSLEGATIGKPVEQLEKEEAKRLEESEKFLLEHKRGV